MLSSQVCLGRHRHEPTHVAHSDLASCCNEAFKIATSSAAFLNNYFMYIGTEGVYSHTFEHEKRPDCPVCVGGSLEIKISIPQDGTVRRVIKMLEEKQCVARFAYSKRRPGCIQCPPFAAKSRNPHCQCQRRRYISRPRHSSRLRHAQI